MLLIKNGYIKTMTGADIENGAILIDDNGKIAAVGADLTAPEGATVIDAEGRLVTPGCVEAHCHIGLDNEAVGWEGHDYNETVDPLTPQMRAIDAIYPQDEAFGNAIKNGVTSACTGPGSANVVGGTFAAIKLVGNRVDNMIIKHPVAMKCAFGENPKRCYGQSGRKAPMTRMGTAALLRELLFKTRRYLQDKEIPFIDTGMDVRRNGALSGEIRTTFCSADEEGKQNSQKYINMTGVAYANETQFKAYYGKLIAAIKAASPDTKIMLQSIFPVSEGYDQKGGKLCNANIDVANGWIVQIASEHGCKYLDTASVLKNGNGAMIALYDSGDGIHMTADAYKQVLQYIRTHGYTD